MNDKKPKQKNPLFNLKKTEYLKGAELTLKNAENLLDIANLCLQNGHNGNGVSKR